MYDPIQALMYITLQCFFLVAWLYFTFTSKSEEGAMLSLVFSLWAIVDIYLVGYVGDYPITIQLMEYLNAL